MTAHCAAFIKITEFAQLTHVSPVIPSHLQFIALAVRILPGRSHSQFISFTATVGRPLQDSNLDVQFPAAENTVSVQKIVHIIID